MAGLGIPIPSVLNKMELIDATTTVVEGTYTEIGRYTVQKGEEVAFGQGAYDKLNEATGRFFCNFFDNASTPNELDGRLRIQVVDYNDNLIFNVGEFDMAQLRRGENDLALRYPWPLQKYAAKYGRRIKLYFKSSTSATLSRNNSKLEMSAMRKYVAND